MKMAWEANWIWKAQESYSLYNQTIVAKKSLVLETVNSAKIAITADSFYRLFINDEWVNDGPCRAWPEYYQYDVIDVSSYLKTGENEITVIAKYFGVGTFHQIPLHPGLLVQLENAGEICAATDDSWLVAEATFLVANTPKISAQMEGFELVDARLEDELCFENARTLFAVDQGPWKNLAERDVRLLTRKDFFLHRHVAAKEIAHTMQTSAIPLARLLYPGLIEGNIHLSLASAIATIVVSDEPREIRIESDLFDISVNGTVNEDGRFELLKGKNFVLGTVRSIFGYAKDATLAVEKCPVRFENPLEPGFECPWCFIPFKEFTWVGDDMVWEWMEDRSERVPGRIYDYDHERAALRERAEAYHDFLLENVRDCESFDQHLRKKAENIPSELMLMPDPHGAFMANDSGEHRDPSVRTAAALISESDGCTNVDPSSGGTVELCYDLGEQNCGYYDFECIAEAGTIVDIFGVEYIRPNGSIQHTEGNRNGLRYICREGRNHYTSLKRRSGQYILIRVSNFTNSVRFKNFKLIESTYPVPETEHFLCDDPVLNKLWEISERTLKLCMEDTFTDCPLYEQTLWVGDARTEALLAYTTYGATDIAKRCILLAAQSLECFPMVGCQAPSSWSCLIPAWSFMWGLSVWDYYFFTGDRLFLEEMWPHVVRNLKGAESYIDETGLFTGPFWNMCDWSDMDDNHKTVLHNSMFFVGALDAAIRCGEIIHDEKELSWMRKLRIGLIDAINELWDDKRGAFPDSIHADGSISESTSQQTNGLSLLYGILPREKREVAIRHLLTPDENTVRIGSSQGLMYHFMAMEKYGHHQEIIQSIRQYYQDMVDSGSTTTWETFRGSLHWLDADTPTRSYCHAWSAIPLYFFSRVILGIRQVEAGGRRFEISPRLSGLKRAEGSAQSVYGPVSVRWQVLDSEFHVSASAPENVELNFVENETHKGLRVSFDSLVREDPDKREA